MHNPGFGRSKGDKTLYTFSGFGNSIIFQLFPQCHNQGHLAGSKQLPYTYRSYYSHGNQEICSYVKIFYKSLTCLFDNGNTAEQYSHPGKVKW